MPIKKKTIQRITAWSYSRYNTYDNCPFKAKCEFIDKIKSPPNKYMKRGSEIHNEAESYSLGETKRRPDSLKLFPEEFKELRRVNKQRRLQTEAQWSVSDEFKPTDWFAKSTWLRARVDATYIDGSTLRIIDHKTGKVRDSHLEQLDIYALVGFAHSEPEIEEVDAALWYLDEGEIKDQVYVRSDLPELQKKWKKKTKKMLTDTTFKPKPSRLCQWCDFSKEKGGPCEF